jgi:hypothetical protein
MAIKALEAIARDLGLLPPEPGGSLRAVKRRAATATIDDLEHALNVMLKGLANYLGDEKRARRILLDAAPTPKLRGVFDVLLKRPRRGRPNENTAGGLTSRKYTAWRDVYAWWAAKNPGKSDREFARYVLEGKSINDKSIRATTGALNRARKALRRD